MYPVLSLPAAAPADCCSTAVGTVEFRSLLEPVRTANPFVNYFEANCDRIDTGNKVGGCSGRGSIRGAGGAAARARPISSCALMHAVLRSPVVDLNCSFCIS